MMILLVSPLFEQILRKTRYGGGLIISLETTDGAAKENVSLIMKSANSMTIWDPKINRFERFEMRHVEKMSYDIRPKWKLPPPYEGVEGILSDDPEYGK